MENDLHLLARYHRLGDAQAFQALVKAHADMVFAAARRITQDAALAEEVAQDTFLALARRDGSVSGSVGAWLHHVARQKASNALRGELRRQRHEMAAAEVLNDKREGGWAEIEPAVDDVLDRLPEPSRSLLIAHFLERRTQEEVARRLGVSQSTISRQIEAALHLLRDGLRQKGLLCSAGLLAGSLSTGGAQAAPRTLAASLGKIAMAGIRPGTAMTSTGAAGAAASAAPAILLTMTTTTKACLAAAAIGALSLPFFLGEKPPPPQAVRQRAQAPAPASPPAPATAASARMPREEQSTPGADQSTALQQQALEDRELIVAEFARIGGSITQVGEQWLEQDIASIVETQFGNDREAFESTLAQQGHTLEEFRTERIHTAIVSIMKAKMTKGITDPEEKKRVLDNWLTDLRLAAVLDGSKTGRKPASTDD